MTRPLARDLLYCPWCGAVSSWDFGLVRHPAVDGYAALYHVRLRTHAGVRPPRATNQASAMRVKPRPGRVPPELAWIGEAHPRPNRSAHFESLKTRH